MRYSMAETIEEVLSLLNEYGEDAKLVSGGTALALLMRQGLVRPAHLIGVSRIPELRSVTVEDHCIRIGAAMSLRKLENHPAVKLHSPMLAETISHVATHRIRNMATIGGGLGHCDPNQDPIVALTALQAQVLVVGPTGRRTIPMSEFCLDYYENALEEGEIIIAVEVPKIVPGTGTSYIKFSPRSVEDYATVGAGAYVEVDSEGICQEARLVLGAVGPTPIEVDVAKVLVGKNVTYDNIQAAAQLAYDAVDPMEDVRGTISYKRDMAVVIGKRALIKAVERALLD